MQFSALLDPGGAHEQPRPVTAAALLEFEATHSHPAGKDTLIRHQFGITRTKYWQILLAYAATETALKQDAITCKRILASRPRTIDTSRTDQ